MSERGYEKTKNCPIMNLELLRLLCLSAFVEISSLKFKNKQFRETISLIEDPQK